MTAHIHAHNMALYAEDAKETDKPWERWQFRPMRKTEDSFFFQWQDADRDIYFSANLEFRRKPVEPKLVPHWPAIFKTSAGYQISDLLFSSVSLAEPLYIDGVLIRLATELPPIMLPEGEVK